MTRISSPPMPNHNSDIYAGASSSPPPDPDAMSITDHALDSVATRAHSIIADSTAEFLLLHSPNFAQFRVRKTELIRLVIDQLHTLGLSQAVSALQEESGITFESQAVTDFRQAVLQGDWTLAHDYVIHPDLCIPKPSVSLVTFILREQEYLELLECGEIAAALTILRDYLTPLHFNLQRLHELSSYLMYTDPNALRCNANWSGALGDSRSAALNRIQAEVPSSVMVPSHRLELLLHQALASQEYQCIYHNIPSLNTSSPRTMSLYDDHSCNPTDHIPTYTRAILNDHEDEVWYLAFSNSGTKLAAAGKNGTTIIWEVKTNQRLHRLDKHDDAVGFLSWSPDDSKLLTCGNDSRFKLWDTNSGACLLTSSRHSDAVTAGGWLGSGHQFLTGSLDKVLAIWELDGSKVHQWAGNRVTDLQVSRDSRIVVTVANQNIRVYDLASRLEIMQFDDTESVTSLHLSRDGRYLLTNTANQELHVWDLNPAPVDILASSTSNHQLSRPNSGQSTPNRSRLSTTDSAMMHREPEISFMSSNSITLPAAIPTFSFPTNEITRSRILFRYAAQPAVNGRTSQLPTAGPTGTSTTPTPNNTKVHHPATPRAVLVRRYTGHKQGKFVIRSTFGGVNEAFLISGSEDNCAFVWHRTTGDLLAVLQGHTSSVNAATWNPAIPGMVATCSDDKTVRIWTPPPA